MPNGECRFSMNGTCTSATPSPFASRSSVMRSADGTPAPASFWNFFIILPLKVLPSSGLSGALVSATRTSPLGSTYNQRGCTRPVANALTAVPDTGVGAVPVGQPLAGATCTTGTTCFSGAGRLGLGPTLVCGDATGPVSVG